MHGAKPAAITYQFNYALSANSLQPQIVRLCHNTMSSVHRILQLTSVIGYKAEDFYLSKALRKEGCEIEMFNTTRDRKIVVIAKVLFGAPNFSKYDAVVITGYALAFAACLRTILTGGKTPIIIVGLNLSGSPIKTGITFIDGLINKIFQKLTLSIVHSQNEIQLFHDLHGLDKSRFAFAHWGYDLPAFDSKRFADHDPYVCMIGRNNRDFKTFCSAIEKTGVNGVIVAPAYAKFDFPVPDQVEIYRDIPFEDCLSCIENAAANLILVNDDERGAGHITAVSAMLLGVPQIYSEVSVLEDYFVKNVTGFAVPIGDREKVAEAIKRLIDNDAQSRKIAERAKDYALRWLSHEAIAQRQSALIMSAINNAPYDQIDPTWAQYIADMSADFPSAQKA